MNIFNKIAVVVLLFGLLALCMLVALFPAGAGRRSEQCDAGRKRLRNMEANQGWLFALVRVALAVLSLVIVLPLLWQEIKPRRPRWSRW